MFEHLLLFGALEPAHGGVVGEADVWGGLCVGALEGDQAVGVGRELWIQHTVLYFFYTEINGTFL